MVDSVSAIGRSREIDVDEAMEFDAAARLELLEKQFCAEYTGKNQEDYEYNDTETTNKPITVARKDKKNSHKVANPNINITERQFDTEKTLISLHELRDELIDMFNEEGIDSPKCDKIVSLINKTGSCLKNLGFPVDKFNPLDHVSGLAIPEVNKNAESVIDNTKRCYKFGSIVESEIRGKVIVIGFHGHKNGTDYKALGEIKPKKDWIGNEAIDYVYTPKSGRMSVKSYINNKWQDISSDYSIEWELIEKDKNDADNDENMQNKKNDKKSKILEENVKNELNNDTIITEDDFEIEEK